MWAIEKPRPVKLIVGVLAADEHCLEAARRNVIETFGQADLVSQTWLFDMTGYYAKQAGPAILRQFVSIDKLIDPGQLSAIKHKANQIEQNLAESLATQWPRPINLDPGYIEPSKLVLASTKNFAHRVYIGEGIWAEVTLTYSRGLWTSYSFTFPDFKSGRYNEFLNKVRSRLAEQRKEIEN
jgi:hypothetical protein